MVPDWLWSDRSTFSGQGHRRVRTRKPENLALKSQSAFTAPPSTRMEQAHCQRPLTRSIVLMLLNPSTPLLTPLPPAQLRSIAKMSPANYYIQLLHARRNTQIEGRGARSQSPWRQSALTSGQRRVIDLMIPPSRQEKLLISPRSLGSRIGIRISPRFDKHTITGRPVSTAASGQV